MLSKNQEFVWLLVACVLSMIRVKWWEGRRGHHTPITDHFFDKQFLVPCNFKPGHWISTFILDQRIQQSNRLMWAFSKKENVSGTILAEFFFDIFYCFEYFLKLHSHIYRFNNTSLYLINSHVTFGFSFN